MAKERVKRKLSAILCADVVGYSRLMGEDEATTLQALKKCDADIIDPIVKEHNGRIFKRMGDGFLVEFSSAVDSVDCAIAWQKANPTFSISLIPAIRKPSKWSPTAPDTWA